MSAKSSNSEAPRGDFPAPAQLGPEEVRVTAEMARLRLSDEEIPRIAVELSRILDLAATLRDVDVTGVTPMTHAVPLSCPLRDDVVGPHDDIATALRNAPATAGDLFTVPAILTGE
jgi:aspartyl-tRNA(Asn)/glutamyl-tRNA(Gln) amidotransferase subunit C